MANRDNLLPVTADSGHYVYDVYNEHGLVAHYARAGDDVWQCVTPTVNEAHGFKRIHIHEKEWKQWVRARAFRLRINVISNKYQYDD